MGINGQQILYDYAMRFVGVPYLWGGNSYLSGIDCSGLVIELLISAGLWKAGEDANAQGLFDHFQRAALWNRFDFGALCFFGESQHSITHVGFGLDRYSMLEAGGGGSRITSFDAAKDAAAVVRVRPINYRRDLVAVLMPQYRFIQGEE